MIQKAPPPEMSKKGSRNGSKREPEMIQKGVGWCNIFLPDPPDASGGAFSCCVDALITPDASGRTTKQRYFREFWTPNRGGGNRN